MTPAATVIVPTHDHGPLLELAVRSALSQTVQELEVIVIGDGVDDLTRAVGQKLGAEDERVRFLDNPKGPRLGEVHRPAAIASPRACRSGAARPASCSTPRSTWPTTGIARRSSRGAKRRR